MCLIPDDATLVRARRALGDFELTICSDGNFKLDGGAMFGVVPKTLWSRRVSADTDNGISLGLNTAVVRTGKSVVLIETGIGNKHPQKLKDIFELKERLPASLAAAGVSTHEVTHVLNTHLHFDHCGWNTTLHPDGTVTPTFPNARYFAAAGELAHGRLQLDRDRVSYLGPNYDPLIQSGQLTLIDPAGAGGFTPADPRLLLADSPPIPIQTSLRITEGISVEPFPGHTASMLGIHIESEGQHACYIGDIFPTRHHLDPTWVMGYDLDPLTSIEQKKRFLAQAIPGHWLVLFPHDHELPATHLTLNEKGKPMIADAD